MSRRPAKMRTAYLVACMLQAMAVLVTGLRADVLVTKNGRRWEGEVVDKGESFVLIRPGGGRMTFPKSMVKEVISSADAKLRLDHMIAAADLTIDAELAKLAAFARNNGLTGEVPRLMARAYRVRKAKAAANLEALHALALWCTKQDMDAEARECLSAMHRMEYPQRRAAAGASAAKLAQLYAWCRKAGLDREAEEATAAALEAAPDDPGIRLALGYYKEASGRWRRLQRDFSLLRSPGPNMWVADPLRWGTMPRRIGIACIETGLAAFGRNECPKAPMKWLQTEASAGADLTSVLAEGAICATVICGMRRRGFEAVHVPLAPKAPLSALLKSRGDVDAYLVVRGTRAKGGTTGASLGEQDGVILKCVACFALFDPQLALLACGRATVGEPVLKAELDKMESNDAKVWSLFEAVGRGTWRAVDESLVSLLQGVWARPDIRAALEAGRHDPTRLRFKEVQRHAPGWPGQAVLLVGNLHSVETLELVADGPVARKFRIEPLAWERVGLPPGAYTFGMTAPLRREEASVTQEVRLEAGTVYADEANADRWADQSTLGSRVLSHLVPEPAKSDFMLTTPTVRGLTRTTIYLQAQREVTTQDLREQFGEPHKILTNQTRKFFSVGDVLPVDETGEIWIYGPVRLLVDKDGVSKIWVIFGSEQHFTTAFMHLYRIGLRTERSSHYVDMPPLEVRRVTGPR